MDGQRSPYFFLNYVQSSLTLRGRYLQYPTPVTHVALLSQNITTVALANRLTEADQNLATWFHDRLTPLFVGVLRSLCELGSSEWIAAVLFLGVVFFVWKRSWLSLVTMVVAVPGGMLFNEGIKLLVQRPRPYMEGPFIDWAGYSFASGHTIGATLLYGQLLLFIIPVMKSWRWRTLAILVATLFVLLVGFGRIALGAHYLSDVLAAILLGALWLGLCFYALQPLHRRVARRELIPDVVVAEVEAMALIPIPVPAGNEPAPVLSH